MREVRPSYRSLAPWLAIFVSHIYREQAIQGPGITIAAVVSYRRWVVIAVSHICDVEDQRHPGPPQTGCPSRPARPNRLGHPGLGTYVVAATAVHVCRRSGAMACGGVLIGYHLEQALRWCETTICSTPDPRDELVGHRNPDGAE